MAVYPNGEFSLSLSVSVNSHKRSSKSPKSASTRVRGIGQTTYSKRMVRNGIYRLESLHGKHNLAFATYTFPELSAEQLQCVRNNWAEIVRQFIQAVSRKLESAGITPNIVHVTEIQMKRYEKYGQLVPHLHLVFQSRKSRYSEYAISKEENTAIWNRIVNNILIAVDDEMVEMPYAADIQKIKKSAQAYMSKYMSKGSSVVHKFDARMWMPKSWWGMSLSLRRWVKENTKILANNTKQWIKDNYHKWIEDIENSPFHYLRCITIDVQDRTTGADIKLPVAIVGRIKKNHIHRFETKDLNALNPFQPYPELHVV